MKIDNLQKLLLHCCCSCCATEVYNRLKDDYKVTLFWYNPNIYPYFEYKSRFDSFVQLASDLNCNFLIRHSRLDRESIDDLLMDPRVISLGETEPRRKPEDDRIWEIENKKWQTAISGLENEPEGGKRCVECYKFRLEQTAKYAVENKFDIYTTTLTISPHKNASIINKIGSKISKDLKINYLESDFKKQDGFKKSIELSHKHDLYRQNYCGCKFSIR